jgi:hypothetical protein
VLVAHDPTTLNHKIAEGLLKAEARLGASRLRQWRSRVAQFPPALGRRDDAHVLAFISAYNFARHLKVLRWRTPFQAITDAWAKNQAPFKINPLHLIPGPNT